MRKVRVTDSHLDLSRGELGRIVRLVILNKVLPLGNLGGGPGWRCVLVLAIVHRFGRPLFRLLVPHEERLTRLYRWIRRGKKQSATPAETT